VKVYEITIKPVSGFGTPLKGDTIFGHFCWQVFYDDKLLGKTLDELLAKYPKNPFAVFSSAYPKFRIGGKDHYALRTPALPMDEIFKLPEDKRKRIKERKEYKAKGWMILRKGEMIIQKDDKISCFQELSQKLVQEPGQEPESERFLNDQELLKRIKANVPAEIRKLAEKGSAKNFVAPFTQTHNTINRFTGKTGEGRFAPYAVEQHVFYPESELALFVGIDETTINIGQVKKGLELIGTFGFGKDASSGLGKFHVMGEPEAIDLAKMGSSTPNAYYTLSPCVPEPSTFEEMFFNPFIRFGRHGDVLAKSGQPFKNPVIMADEGGVLIPKKGVDISEKLYLGKAVTGISKAQTNAVMQGYALYIPVKVSDKLLNRVIGKVMGSASDNMSDNDVSGEVQGIAPGSAPGNASGSMPGKVSGSAPGKVSGNAPGSVPGKVEE